MTKVLPDDGEPANRATGGIPVGPPSGALEFIDVGFGHDGRELGVHSGSPPIAFNVDPRMD
jgi:hypothetical protein